MINIIAAMTEDRVIGFNNNIPWHISEDLKLFKKNTMDSVLIMGRKTFESLNEKPLPGRINIVISRTIHEKEGFVFYEDLDEALLWANKQNKEIFIIGGGEIYKKCIFIADKLYLSFVKEKYKGDVYFPEIDFAKWNNIDSKEYDDFCLKIYVKKGV